jgi:hypothetical protein
VVASTRAAEAALDETLAYIAAVNSGTVQNGNGGATGAGGSGVPGSGGVG